MTSDQSSNYPRDVFYLINCFALVCTLTIILLSAHIRLGESGLGCDPWPACYTQTAFLDTTQGLDIPQGEYQNLRAAHRLFASLLGIAVICILCISLWYRRTVSPTLPILMFIVVVFLSLLGISTPTRTTPAVTLGNVLGGIVLIALIWRQLLAIKVTSKHSGPHRLIHLLSMALTIQILTGIWASANYTASACPELLSCDFISTAPDNLISSFDPTRTLHLDTNLKLEITQHMDTIQFVHRLVSVMLAVIVLIAFIRVKRDYENLLKPMIVVASVFLAEFLLGVFNVLADMPLWSNTLHNCLAVVLLLSTIYLGSQVKRTQS
jgi:cytochrome c oxidase assembly protein subunit 15